MASSMTTENSVIAKDEILDDYIPNNTDDIAVEISPVEGYSEIKLLSSPASGIMLSPNNDLIKNDINFSCSSPDSTSTIITSTAAGNDNDNIPQWKKDLIQRRKTNIARTIGANQSVTCPKKGFMDALELTTKQEKDEDKTTTSIKTLPSPVLPLTKSNLFILESPNNSKKNNNNSINSISLDDTSSSEYLEINLHSSRYKKFNNDELNISSNNKEPVNNYLKNTIKVQHKQQSNYEYDNKDINDDVDNNDDIDDSNEMPVLSGGQYTINNINKSGNTIIKSSEIYQQQQTSHINNIKNNFSTPIPKQRNGCLIKNNSNNSPTGETSFLLTATEQQLNNNNTTNISNNSSLCSDATSNILNIADISNSVLSSSIVEQKQQQLNISPSPSQSSILTSSALSTTSSIQLHSKHDTVKLLDTVGASSSLSSINSNELIKTVGLENNNLIINKKCGIGIINPPATTLLKNPNLYKNLNKSNINNNNNKYIKNIQNSSNINHQKLKIKKMVAAHDIINDSATGTGTTTTTTTTNCHNQTQPTPTIILDDNDSTLSQFNDFDSSEELQYGPGIVSKLRVRYLSLALRQTNGKQRTHLDNLRRATSLNNLLDGGGSTGSTNDGSIIDGDIDNDINQQNHHHHHQQQQILNHITQNNQQQQNKIHKNVSWLNENEQQLKQNSNNLIKNYIKEQEYLNSNDDIDVDVDDIENSKEFDIEKNNGGKFLYEKNYKKPDNFYNNKTGNNYQHKKELIQQQQQKQRNGRQVKRGNDSLKRARSVEALLCEKSSWLNNNKNLNSSIGGKMCISSGDGDCGGGEMLLVTEKPDSNEINLIGIDNNHKNLLINQHEKLLLKNEITIEDKIINARDRLHCTEKQLSPPKRLTSIIDDTERPPPDLVKQTLKLFEATANRRNGRSLSRNTNNQVAVKIANYKSIISQEKPAISYPKPPLSPKRNNNNMATTNNIVVTNKKPNTLDLKTTTATKTNNVIGKKSNSPINSPVSNLAKKFSGIENNEIDLNNKYKSSPTTVVSPLPPQILPRNNIQRNNNDNAISPPQQQQQRTPDLIPRKHFENLNHQQQQNISTDSPITQLTKKLNRLNIQNSPAITSSPSPPITMNDEYNNKNQFTAKSIDELTNDTDSITSDDDTDGCNGDIMIKRVSKTALDNISKAGTTQHFSFNNNSSKMNDQHQLHSSTPAKQINIIRPLVTELKKDNLPINNGSGNNSNSGGSNIDNIKPQRDNLVISNLSQTKNQFNNNNSTSKTKFIDNNSSSNIAGIDKPALTTREIEKNLINEKKNELANLETKNDNGINSNSSTSTPPIWQLNKKIKIGSNFGQPIETQNNIMVFNFQDRKDVPDYIENDGLLIKRRRELPKPNESGFVLLGDLTLETSTDSDESWTMMGPPSPCNVEFENANIIIDGKSNLRYRSKEISLRVQFDDTLTSTFEYPSESSFLDDSVVPTVESFSNTIDSLEHIDADEIIEIPSAIPVTTTKSSSITTPTGQKSLGNISLGSAPLGSYTPIKAQIQTNFELGITRVPNNTNQMNGGSSLNDNQQLNGKEIINSINNGIGNGDKNIENETTTDTTNKDTAAIEKIIEPESLQYLKPATDDLTVVYSEGTQKTDLLY